jgi:hypothetical protein
LAATSEARWTQPLFKTRWQKLKDDIAYGKLHATDLGDLMPLVVDNASSLVSNVTNSSRKVTNSSHAGDDLLVVIAAHCPDEQQWILLMALICGVRKFHGERTTIFIVDNGSPPPYDEKIHIIARLDDRVLHKRFGATRWEWGALNETMSWLDKHGADRFKHVAYFQHSMVLERPLPLDALACPLVSFQRFGPGWFGTNFVERCDAWMVTLDKNLAKQPCRVPETLYFTYSVSFVAHAWAALKLHRLGLWSRIGPLTQKGEDETTERLMAVASDYFLRSGPDLCNLDGDFQHLPTYVSKYSHGGRVYAKDYYAGLKGGSISNQTWSYKDVDENNLNVCLHDRQAWPAFYDIIKEAKGASFMPSLSPTILPTHYIENHIPSKPLEAAALPAPGLSPPSKVTTGSQVADFVTPNPLTSPEAEVTLADLKALQQRLRDAGLDSSLPSAQFVASATTVTAGVGDSVDPSSDLSSGALSRMNDNPLAAVAHRSLVDIDPPQKQRHSGYGLFSLKLW